MEPGPEGGQRALGGQIFHVAQLGTAQRTFVATTPSRGHITYGKNSWGQVYYQKGGNEDRWYQWTGPGWQTLALGTWSVTSLRGKEPELVRDIHHYRLDMVGLPSTRSISTGTKPLDWGWNLFFSGTAQGVRHQSGVGILAVPGGLQLQPPAQLFSCIPVKVWDIKTEWSMFKASITEAVSGSFGLRVKGASRGSNLQTSWWTPGIKKAV